MTKADVCVVGLGYIGLPTAAIFARHGLHVHGVDVSERVVGAVNRGRVPFVEPDLGGFVSEAVRNGNLVASDTPVSAETFIVAVPTPFREGHEADLSYIEDAARAVAKVLTGDELIILESTSPPGATHHMADVVFAERADLQDADLKFAHCPERVLPGKVMTELVENDRIIGGITLEAAEAARDLYRVFCRGELLLTNAITAEMAKLTENSFRDVNIAFANELSVICDRLGIDVWELIELANHHPRVNILQPGPGVGGHCIAVDPWFIVAAAPEEARLIRTARTVNDDKPGYVIERVEAAVGDIETPKVAMLGLAFKPNIDDLRESPALEITKQVAQAHPEWQILAVEPNIEELPPVLANYRNVSLTGTDAALEQADVVVVLVDHTPFKAIAADRVADLTVVDTKGLWR
ncbi:UDP-N-acetyl-D-mannosamine dehydrogenase [Enemella sp. A6]|uniref:UDP-N-acetyl-D-mannosamine dehydrogenase n=1 Tax=Enemella sp. A6 TaxID=3440152 RepID=UPI003EC053E5